MTGAVATTRYRVEDLETASIRSAAPSYVSDTPSYHTVAPYPEAVPPYSPPASQAAVAGSAIFQARGGASTSRQRQQTIGLPPIPPLPSSSVPNLNNFRVATWSNMNSNPNVRHYQNVAQRRVTAQRDPIDLMRRQMTSERALETPAEPSRISRPLEDPVLVGEQAAATARRERIARETGEDILVREDRQWDCFLAQIKDWDERERSWKQFRREHDTSQRRKLLRRIGGRLML